MVSSRFVRLAKKVVLFVCLLLVLFLLWYSGEYGNLEYEPIEPVVKEGPVYKQQLPIIYIVTPTYKRAAQMADMTRLAQTLQLVPSIHWIVVEDSENLTQPVSNLLRRTGVPFTHLCSKKPKNKTNPTSGRGVANRMKAIEWLRNSSINDGVLYFADDDNSYDVRIFEEMRWTKKASVWPVGLASKYSISSPILKDGKVIGFHDGFKRSRLFAVDMAGFAVSIRLLKQSKNPSMPYRLGHLEDGFLKSLKIKMRDLEPKAANCTEVLVWHTKTLSKKMPSWENVKKEEETFTQSNLKELYSKILN
ncbi:galactosylgalactosylxylosylprotein 3-beta-glucuronosyltransferase S-like [Limulus polyphemus]|uniref:Galactosylgalactosylxylosylprotein 3-beta-glucuronosyltransferase n=1 Tax=Limulus polyphemus TaxID=6850 RepID=A0ABM1THL2_LIMPO|nr:galactosylgalactosylxylosylprotein 3-beta-glucuronosyltransferase S-like [Limulus polyphemus]XP_022255369.1 galactosylgalactosylxylosylprotein 3-beta-glucuronosyltransferase S-like [Limulus polyphemus]